MLILSRIARVDFDFFIIAIYGEGEKKLNLPVTWLNYYIALGATRFERTCRRKHQDI